MAQSWHDLLFAHWQVDAAALQSLLPPQLQIDTFEGSGWLAVVPFRMTGVRVGAVRPAHVSATLNVANVSETVTVTAGNSEAINGRRVDNLSLIASGAAKSAVSTEEVDASVSEAMTSGHSGVEADTEAGEVGDLFEYQIAHPVTVRRDHSALIPIVQTRMEGTRVSVFRESEGRSRPMSGMLLKNTSPLTLEGGSLTVIDGDADNIETARDLAPEGVEFVHAWYKPADVAGFDLVVFPLAFRGDRLAIYRQPPAPLVVVHDWLWRRRGASVVVSWLLLKRLNLVTP